MSRTVRSIVVGVATDPDPALGPAIRLAAQTGAELVVVHVFDPACVPAADQPGEWYVRRPYRLYAERLMCALGRQVAEHGGGDGIQCRIVHGTAAEVLPEIAEHLEAGLLVVGATRRGTLGRAVLGTTAQKTIQRARCPVLMIRPPLARPVRRVLLTTDLSELSVGVHQVGLELVGALFGTDGPALRSLLVAESGGLGTTERLEAAAEGRIQLRGFLASLPPHAGQLEGSVRVGSAAREIVAETADWYPDLLVLGTHGRTGISRALLGSVAEAVLPAALCSVLVVPAAVVHGDRVEGPPAALPASPGIRAAS